MRMTLIPMLTTSSGHRKILTPLLTALLLMLSHPCAGDAATKPNENAALDAADQWRMVLQRGDRMINLAVR